MTNDPLWCSRCNARPCQLIGAQSGPQAYARAQRHREQAKALMAAWEAHHQRRLAASHIDVQRAMRALAFVEARRLASRGSIGPVTLDPAAVTLAKQQLVTQLRRQRHGNVEDTASAEQWTAQCTAIAAELGIDWAQLNGQAREAAA